MRFVPGSLHHPRCPVGVRHVQYDPAANPAVRAHRSHRGRHGFGHSGSPRPRPRRHPVRTAQPSPRRPARTRTLGRPHYVPVTPIPPHRYVPLTTHRRRMCGYVRGFTPRVLDRDRPRISRWPVIDRYGGEPGARWPSRAPTASRELPAVECPSRTKISETISRPAECAPHFVVT
jgi:hypothetical protein